MWSLWIIQGVTVLVDNLFLFARQECDDDEVYGLSAGIIRQFFGGGDDDDDLQTVTTASNINFDFRWLFFNIDCRREFHLVWEHHEIWKIKSCIRFNSISKFHNCITRLRKGDVHSLRYIAHQILYVYIESVPVDEVFLVQ